MGNQTSADWIDEILRIHAENFGGARMEEGDPPGGTGDPPKDPPGEKQLPQSQVNEIVAARTREAKEQALKALADELGVTIDEAKRIVKERKETDDKNATELEKANQARTQAEKDRDEKVSASTRELHAERADRALIAAGAPDEDSKLERLRGMLTVEVGATRDDVKKDVEKLKTDFPALFETQPPPPSGRRTSTDPPKGKAGKVSDTAYERGQERAHSRYSSDGGVPRPAIPGVSVPTN